MKDTDTDTMEMTNDQLADLIRRFENRMIERWNDMDRKMMRWNAGPEDLPTTEDRATNDAEKQERDEEGDGDEIGEALTTSPIKDAAIDGEIAETKDKSILNLPVVVSAPTTDNIMKQTEVDTEPVVRNGVVSGGADVTERDMEVVKGKTDKGKENKAPAPTSVKDGEKSETQKKREAKKANKKADEGGSKEDAKDDGPDVSNGKYGVQEMNQSKDKPKIYPHFCTDPPPS